MVYLLALPLLSTLISHRLGPHEDASTDVVLLAHSMGGLVAADVALLCRHRIIGVINFDVPFLGMHPGIIKAGLGSIFKPWPEPQDQIDVEPDPANRKPSRFDTLFNPRPNDPNFNPSFPNDVHLPARKGWENTLHWLSKHSNGINGIVQASKGLVQSHLEFGGAMADYRSLKARYVQIRALEEENEQQRSSVMSGIAHPPRIRFVNYYTTSTGRPKKPKSPKSPSPSPSLPVSKASPLPKDSSPHLAASVSQLQLDTENSEASSARPSTEHTPEDSALQIMPPTPMDDVDDDAQSSVHDVSSEAAAGPTLPEIPPIPREPPFVDLAQFTDKTERKAAEKEHDQALKTYQRAVKARNKIINDRDKIQEKWERQKKKDQQLREKQAQKDRQLEQKQMEKEIQLEEKQLQKTSETRENSQGKDKTESTDETDLSKEDTGVVQLGAQQSSRSSLSDRGPYGNYDFSRSMIMNQAEPDEQASYTTASNPPSSYNESTYSLTTTNSHIAPERNAPPKKKRLKKFCMLPPEDNNGNKDPAWIRVFMEGVDEVAAHTTLFFVNDTYERLVGDVGARIEEWVSEADSLRLVRELQGL